MLLSEVRRVEPGSLIQHADPGRARMRGVAVKQRSRAKQKQARRRIAGAPGDELAASRRQRDYENASSNRKSVLQNRNSQIRHATTELLPHVIAGKGPRNRS